MRASRLFTAPVASSQEPQTAVKSFSSDYEQTEIDSNFTQNRRNSSCLGTFGKHIKTVHHPEEPNGDPAMPPTSMQMSAALGKILFSTTSGKPVRKRCLLILTSGHPYSRLAAKEAPTNSATAPPQPSETPGLDRVRSGTKLKAKA